MDLKYAVFKVDLGWVGVMGSSRGIVTATTFPQLTPDEALLRFGERVAGAAYDANAFSGLIERLKAYYAGKRVDSPDKLDLTDAPPFFRRVWEVTRSIPYGETRSYAWVAQQTGNRQAARAVGQAMSRNPIPIIIPCHRVVTSNGKLGGFSGGLEIKRFLINMEAMARLAL